MNVNSEVSIILYMLTNKILYRALHMNALVDDVRLHCSAVNTVTVGLSC